MIRFWSKVAKAGPNECWLWIGALNHQEGYGRFFFDGVVRNASRVAFFLTHGYWPVCACHTCDNPPCCNPAHLYDGTKQQNAKDMFIRRRVRRDGIYNGRSKLSPKIVERLKAKPLTGAEVIAFAEKHDVAFSTVYRVQRGETWT